jgi:hypothetical protein
VKITQTTTPLKILSFDIENRPLSYWYDGKCTAEITAIAWSWLGSDEVQCELLTLGDARDMVWMLSRFRNDYNAADLVTGHYIRRHDLPIINGALMEQGMKPLRPKLTHDTKQDLIKRDGLSMSQEALGAMLGLDSPKVGMTQSDWREANRLTPEGVLNTRRRVVGDVIQHKELYRALRESGYLKAPKLWRP